ncbi:MAG TPA: 3-hydroxyacyl-CoA dehydrogenase NAD-binding domain-containing protein [Gemmatimonadaceae bacterium]|nr:3-hydroxyacyl-CoA dehydrogenase NAD-binding domain-containing protein [Gemmatimonadaceae bacterium]HRQ77774.1 3-hydroxyacyl-CoA dehydrogenase NAD-binding domain-containing protein [Gemmatimonadaceae bacterium]
MTRTLGAEAIVGVIGAGTMGAGIAQVAASNGHAVVLADASASAVAKARDGHAKAMARDVEKGRRSRAEADAVLARIEYVAGVGPSELEAFARCGLVIEAIVEDLAVKQTLFRSLEAVVAQDAVLATNTSSLSIAAIAGGCQNAERVVGIHFFNPAPLMALVEVIPALATDRAVVDASRALVERWGKVPVVASDTPGFIVNRIARPFYGESLRILEEGIADAPTIDWAMRTLGGFKMGPFELMDLIGNDVNYAVTCSVFEAMYYDPRYRPSLTQRRLVESGWLGRKAKRGYYDYRDGADLPAATEDEVLGRTIRDRVVAMLINEAVDAVQLRVASPEDIELAMTKGVNYPRGLLSWGDALGPAAVLATLESLQQEYGEDRYRPSPLLRRVAASGGKLLP